MEKKNFKRVFDVNKYGNETPAYLSYMNGAEKVWDAFSDKYELRPRSIAKAENGKNRGVEIYKDGVHIAGISIGLKDASLYVHDEKIRMLTEEKYQIDNRNQYRIPNITLEMCIGILRKAL